METSVPEIVRKQVAKPCLEFSHVGTKRQEVRGVPKSQMAGGRGMSGDSVQWRRYGVPWHPRDAEFQTGKDKM